MTLFAGLAVFMLARCLMPGFRKMLVATSAVTALRDQNTLAGFRQIGDEFVPLLFVRDRAHGNQQGHIVAGLAGAIGTFAVAAAVSLEFPVVTVAQQRVVVGIGFKVDTAAASTIAAGGSSAWNVFFATERDAAVATVAGFYVDFGFVNEHFYPTCEPASEGGRYKDKKTEESYQEHCGGVSVEILRPPAADSG